MNGATPYQEIATSGYALLAMICFRYVILR